ncbi:MAG: ParB/RepB/Spo0J family partition protein [Saccharofermentanales bacterium]
MNKNSILKKKNEIRIEMNQSPSTSGSHKGLGRGLEALLSSEGISENDRDSIVILKINDINPNVDQPRKAFNQEKLNELADSIKANGIIMPIIVRKEGLGYKIVAGERRWRAARIAGLAVIPALVRDLSDVQVMEQALIENIQRQDLNPMEESNALDRLIKEHHLTQEKLSTIVGRSRPAITNALRLLNLPVEIQELIIQDELTAGHARALLSLPDAQMQMQAAKTLIEKQYSVRDAEKLVKYLMTPKKEKPKADPQYINSVKEFEQKLTKHLGTKVKLKDKNKKGNIVIEYYSYEDLDRIYDLITKE